MVSVEYLKQVITPKDLAIKTLGEPCSRKRSVFWYRSPFRAEEKMPSFEVTDQGFHDFGTNEHFDIIAFTRRLNRCSFKEACEWLAKLYGLSENEYDNKRVQEFLKRQRIEKKNYKDKVETWFIALINLVEEAWKENETCIKHMQKYDDILEELYKRQVFLGCLREEILETDSFEQKAQLRNQITKERLPEWMRFLKGYSSTLEN